MRQSIPKPASSRRCGRAGGRRTVLGALIAGFCLLFAGVAPAGAQEITYTALGDSLAWGAFAPIGQGYVPLYRSYVAQDTGRSVFLYNLGAPGWSTTDLRYALERRLLFQLLVWKSEVVTVNIGGNDLRAARSSYKNQTCGGADNQDCLRAAVATFRQNWDAIIGRILWLRGSRPTIIRTLDIYNPYIGEDQVSDTWIESPTNLDDLAVLKPYLDSVNAYIAGTTARFGRPIPNAPVYESFNGPSGLENPRDLGLISFDGFHANRAGHALMASLLRALGYGLSLP
ncbi:MAG: GDSL-type esterase/lipase family protein [Acidobacteriota bacterium]